MRIIITSNHLRTCSSNSLWILALYLLRFLSATSCMKLSQSLGYCRNFFSESTSKFVCCVFLLCKQSTLTKTRRGLGKDLCCTKVVHLSTYNIHKYLFIDMMFMDVFIFFCVFLHKHFTHLSLFLSSAHTLSLLRARLSLSFFSLSHTVRTGSSIWISNK